MNKDRWSPLTVGAFIAGLSLLSWLLFHHMPGTSSTFVRLAAAFWRLIHPEHLRANSYYKNYLDHNVWINWQLVFVIGIFIGAYLAGRSSRQQKKELPEIDKGKIQRPLTAFLGGVVILFGGCTSGHVISGGMQLAVSGWLFMVGLFAAGVPAAYLLYRRK
jgi:uncharacterized protein